MFACFNTCFNASLRFLIGVIVHGVSSFLCACCQGSSSFLVLFMHMFQVSVHVCLVPFICSRFLFIFISVIHLFEVSLNF